MANGLQLGITKIGDLLINNEITQIGKKRQVPISRLAIPEYQRPYKWTAKNANQLLDDIEDAHSTNKEKYRVGTLILHEYEDNKYNIVDGQQRTITFSLLLKCLVDKPVAFMEERLANNSFNYHNVMNNYRALRRRIDSLFDPKDKEALAEYVINHCELIVVITDNLSEAFQFFDSQNARGKALYPHDLLKAYHLREMNNLDVMETERIVKMWENLNQKKLAVLFNEYLYRLKEWMKGNRSFELTERNIDIFKGVNSQDSHPFAKYYKGAYAYADEINRSHVGFVTGMQELSPFQLDAPIIAGKPFFEYAKHYFDILTDIQNNDKYEGYFINDNEIVKTLDLRKNKNGVGNGITRLMFDTSILLYVDRFCPARPSKSDIDYLEQFVVFAFIWAYSMRAQYKNVGWLVAQNYITGNSNKDDIVNSFNMYKKISESDSPGVLLSKMADTLLPIEFNKIKAKTDNIDEEQDGIYQNYLHFFKDHKFLQEG